jgi:UDP-GlcNAc:undecaprenyl-phosphate GlcNAc-1-phosphate transferase
MFALQLSLSFVASLGFALAMIPLIIRLAHNLQLYDRPDDAVALGMPRKIHTTPIPRLGGVGIVGGFFLSQILVAEATPYRPIILMSLIAFATGFIDDLVHLSAKLRLAIQLLLASAVVFYGNLAPDQLVLTPDLIVSLSYPLSFTLGVFVIVGAINSINMIDGLDGLAGGVTLIGVVMLSLLYFTATHDASILLFMTLPVVGGILGFLRYNTHPASIFMGDCGSNWLGFIVGVLILQVLKVAPQPAAGPSIMLVSTILCLAIPVFDTACVMASRMKEGKSPFKADKRHFHHTLIKLGLSQTQSVTAVYFLALTTGFLGIIPQVSTKVISSVWIPYVAAMALMILIPMSVNVSRSQIHKITSKGILARSHSTFSKPVAKLINLWEMANRYAIYFIFLGTPLLAGQITREVGYSALASFVLVSATFFAHLDRRFDLFHGLAIAVSSAVILVANNLNPISIEILGTRTSIQPFYNMLFVFLLGSSLLLFLVTFRRRYFIFSASDFLMVGLPLLMLAVPQPYKSLYKLDIIALRAVVLFLSIRLMERRRTLGHGRMMRVIWVGSLIVASAGILGLKVVY